MNMQEIRVLAKDLGIKYSRMKKAELIKTIQLTEGNFGCFSTAITGECDQTGCLWREDCLSVSAKNSLQ